MENDRPKPIELRSEKVRSIIGQIPPALVRYGTIIIGLALASLFGVAALLPYNQVFSGTATVRELPAATSDSLQTTLLLSFDGKRPDVAAVAGAPIRLIAPDISVSGRVDSLSAERDTLGRQAARCRLPAAEMQSLAGTETDFTLVETSGSLLAAFLGRIAP